MHQICHLRKFSKIKTKSYQIFGFAVISLAHKMVTRIYKKNWLSHDNQSFLNLNNLIPWKTRCKGNNTFVTCKFLHGIYYDFGVYLTLLGFHFNVINGFVAFLSPLSSIKTFGCNCITIISDDEMSCCNTILFWVLWAGICTSTYTGSHLQL